MVWVSCGSKPYFEDNAAEVSCKDWNRLVHLLYVSIVISHMCSPVKKPSYVLFVYDFHSPTEIALLHISLLTSVTIEKN